MGLGAPFHSVSEYEPDNSFKVRTYYYQAHISEDNILGLSVSL
jgi:hypothetical protein